MNPFCSMVRAALSIAVIGLGLSSAAAIETTLQGWGDYRFGMTPDQVRALPGTSWSNLETKPGLGFYYMNGLAKTRIEGHDFKALATFDQDKKLLYSVTFTEVGVIKPLAECERGFQNLLRTFDKRYGSFSPDLEPGKKLFGYVEWRPLPGSTSKYHVLTLDVGGVRNFHAEAKRKFGRGWVAVYIEADAPAGGRDQHRQDDGVSAQRALIPHAGRASD